MTPSKAPKTSSLLGVLRFLARYPGGVSLAIALLLVNISIEMSLPQLLGNAITQLREESSHSRPADFPLDAYVKIFVALVLIRGGVGMILGRIRNRVIQRTLGDLRAAIYDAIQRLGFTYHDKSNSGELISRSTTDVWRLQDFFYACLFLSIDIAISLVATLALIFACSPLLGFVTLATVVPTITLIIIYARKLQPQWRGVHDLHSAMTTVIQENIAGVRVVKAFAREQAQIAKFRGKKDAFIARLTQTVNYWAGRVPFAQFIFGLSTPLILWLGGWQVIKGNMPIGDLAKIVFYLMAIGYRIGAVGQFTNIIQNASASAERILEILREQQTITTGNRDLPAGRGEVRFEGVNFNYRDSSLNQTGVPAPKQPTVLPLPQGEGRGEGEKRVQTESRVRLDGLREKLVESDPPSLPRPSLTNVSFVADPGKTIAILGPTGSGKTTLVNLIPRFYEVSGGQVLIDGANVRELKLDQLRRSIGVIFQESFLFSATVAENIAYGKQSSSEKEIEFCARAAQAHEFIMELEKGYQTVIGERGISLSGGQRQRIAIARAFLMNPRILILDDATSSVDARTEHLIQQAMRRLSEGRTTFVIAHRLSTVQHADQILVLKEGQIVERGTHAELIERSGFYREVFEQQVKLS